MSINEFVEMTIFLCLICFSIYDKMQGFIDEYGWFLFNYYYFFFFCVLHRNSRWPPKVAGKQFLQKVARRLCRSPVGQKFCRNRSILFRFRDKHVFVIYAEIQDGCQKWRENNFCKKSPVDSANILRVKNFVEIAPSCSVSEINAFSAVRKIVTFS